MPRSVFPTKPEYEQFLYSVVAQFPAVRQSTLHFFTTSSQAGLVRGSVHFHNGLEIRVGEVIDFAAGELLDYSYTVYRGGERILWYDPQPHPNDPTLAATFPHHKHEPPDIKHNRRPAPGIRFDSPNLPKLIAEIGQVS